MAEILEHGDIYFLYRPARGEREVGGVAGVQRFHVVLKPQGREAYRSLVVGHKKLPAPHGAEAPGEGGERRYWGFVERVIPDADTLRAEFEPPGEGEEAAARPAGEGIYAIVRHENHTDLVYTLELPEEPGEAQRDLHIEREATYVLAVKNPRAGTPAGLGLDLGEKASFPEALQARFGDKRWAPANPTDFLDHEGAEFILIGSDEAILEEVGAELHAEAEASEAGDVLKDLHLGERDRLSEPLFRGTWR